MGTVWRAVDELLRQEVAVKEVRLPPDLDESSRAQLCERTLREARAAAGLRAHPSIVTVHDVVMEDGRPWIVMELVRGRSLAEVVRQDGPLPPWRVAGIGLALLDALAAAHATGILHRDVKPANVLVKPDGQVILTDFGIATLAGDTALTQTGKLTGSPGYMAPERLRGESERPESDLWSLGATLYTAVEGRRAFTRDNPAAVMAAVLMYEPDPMTHAGPLAPVLTGLLDKDPVRRCTGAEAAARLHAIAAGTAPPQHTVAMRTRRSRMPVALVALGAVLVGALVAGTGFAVWNDDGRKDPDSTRVSPQVSPQRGVAAPAALFSADPKACDLLTLEQARTLLGGSPKQQFQTKSACLWMRQDNGTVINLVATRFTGTQIAQTAFVQMRDQMKEEPQRYAGTRLRVGPAVGDESFSHTRREVIVQPIYRTQVLFRTANVVVTVYHTGHSAGFRTADQAAHLVATALGTPH